ncbi:EAL domain-containing protein [Deinococcus cavernae]|uniref:EAL domain-containing protein n=1 Tax=Deinococcus cavernae TaxID=2320857 RepID=A0A418V5Z6_9DEIO|nr:EAL domain-containing protein [Deinococcus cavernae]RJF71507.1 EAL domain-containing protein [Deinococcus cavernae]
MSEESLPSVPSTDEAQVSRLQELLRIAEPLVVADVARAEQLLREAQALAFRLGDARSEALALIFLSATSYFRSEYQTALDTLAKAQAAADLVQDDLLTARIENSRGNCAVALGHYGEAMEHYQTSLALAQARGDVEDRARVLNNVGLVHIDLGDYPLALEVFQEVRKLAQQSKSPHAYSSALINTVLCYYHVGSPEEALALASGYLPTIQELHIRQHEVVLRTWMLPCLIDTGEVAEAARQAEELLPLALEVDDRQYVVYVRMFAGQALLQLGQLGAAQEQLELALEDARRSNIRPQQRSVLLHLSRLHAARREWQQAYEHSQLYQALDRELHTEAVERKAKVLGAQIQVEILRREAEHERRRSTELAQANTALQAAQEALAYRATHDALTGLANRAHFQHEVERELQTLDQGLFGLLFIDLDRFKQVNDTLGHDVGDELLKEVGRRLTQVVRSSDLVARMGGDEFTVVLRQLRSAQDAERVAHKILNELIRPVEVGGHTLHVTGSIGVAVAPRDGRDVTTLQKNADIAMYRVKHEGKNGVQAFQPTMTEETAGRVDVERDLRGALARNEFVLHYQGQFDVQTRALVGYEALVRWQHPTRGLLSPGAFLGIAEDSKLIVPLGEWVLQEACRQAAAWGSNTRGLSISVNVSALQFEHPSFLPAVQKALELSGLDPHRLILELSESSVLSNAGAASQLFTHLKALGVRIALDDFGTGQSSVSMLRSLPIDILKIDRSFMHDQGAQKEPSEVFISVVINLAHGLNMLVTAEGVESSGQMALLGELGCDSIQGFLLARPLPLRDIEAHLGDCTATSPVD